jgi:putative SOS response-associated peptidase YedK
MTSRTIIVTDANALTRAIHDRIPVLLDPAHFGAWLGGADGTELLRSADDNKLRMWPPSRLVNKTGGGDDDPPLIDSLRSDARAR